MAVGTPTPTNTALPRKYAGRLELASVLPLLVQDAALDRDRGRQPHPLDRARSFSDTERQSPASQAVLVSKYFRVVPLSQQLNLVPLAGSYSPPKGAWSRMFDVNA